MGAPIFTTISMIFLYFLAQFAVFDLSTSIFYLYEHNAQFIDDDFYLHNCIALHVCRIRYSSCLISRYLR